MSVYRFGDWILHEASSALFRESQRIPLRSKCFELLLYLIRCAPNSATKVDIDSAVWNEGAAGDASIAQAVHEIRKVLRDDSIIATVPRVGYRFAHPGLIVTPDYPNINVRDDLEAFRPFALGMKFLEKISAYGLRAAADCFREAIDLRPSFAPAYAALSHAYILLNAYSVHAGASVVDAAGALAHRALELDATQSLAWTTLACSALLKSDVQLAERTFLYSLGIPGVTTWSKLQYVSFLMEQSRLPEALDQIQRLLAEDPASTVGNIALGQYWEAIGELENAEHQLRFTISLEPLSALAKNALGHLLIHKAQRDEGMGFLKEHSLMGTPAYGSIGYAFARAGNTAAAHRILHQIQARAAIPNYYSAMVASGLGEVDAALTFLEDALESERHVIRWIAT